MPKPAQMPSGIQWCVVTGAPSSGKSTVLEELKNRGYKVCFEVARDVIDEARHAGKDVRELRGTPELEKRFQRDVLDRKKELEKQLDPNTLTFLERGIPDTAAYAKMQGWLVSLPKTHYKCVFWLEPLPFISDYARTETPEAAKRLDELLGEAYASYGPRRVRVPILSVKERADFIVAQALLDDPPGKSSTDA
jgi:predicted ATPase